MHDDSYVFHIRFSSVGYVDHAGRFRIGRIAQVLDVTSSQPCGKEIPLGLLQWFQWFRATEEELNVPHDSNSRVVSPSVVRPFRFWFASVSCPGLRLWDSMSSMTPPPKKEVEAPCAFWLETVSNSFGVVNRALGLGGKNEEFEVATPSTKEGGEHCKAPTFRTSSGSKQFPLHSALSSQQSIVMHTIFIRHVYHTR